MLVKSKFLSVLAVANRSGAMEADTISINGRSSKSHMSSRKFHYLFIKNILFLICCTLFATNINAQVWECGDKGDNVRARLDNGTLIIRGSGNMNNQSPWRVHSGSIREVIIENGVTSIGNNAFSGCSGLTSVTIPNSVTSIGGSVFNDCTSLTSVIIPNSVTSIGNNVFNGCIRLSSVNIPNGVKIIGESMFARCKDLTSITIPNSVTSIGENAFFGCNSLTSINIPNSVISIGARAFKDCIGLTSITIHNSVTKIGRDAFDGCNNLTSIIFGNSSIDNIPIHNSLLVSINADLNNSAFSSEDGVLFNKAKTELIRYPAGKTDVTYTVPKSVTTIKSRAFADSKSLTSVIIPENVKKIESGAFENCIALTSVQILDDWTIYDGSAFRGCINLPMANKYTKCVNVTIKQHPSYGGKDGSAQWRKYYLELTNKCNENLLVGGEILVDSGWIKFQKRINGNNNDELWHIPRYTSFGSAIYGDIKDYKIQFVEISR